MNELSGDDIVCLEKIARSHSDVFLPCADSVARKLLALGLIEERPNLRIPLEVMRLGYYLTAKGAQYLQQNR